MIYFITHPDVVVDSAIPVPQWPLSERGRERMQASLRLPWVAGIRAVHSSTEQKAVDGAEILARHLGLPFRQVEALGENDRSATGYLPGPEFEATADQFFAAPTESVRGWETAEHAQRRVVTAVDEILRSQQPGGDIAIVGRRPDGDAWRIGLQHPRSEGDTLRTLRLHGGGVASSGDYARCVVIDGVRYGHILNPRSGWPVRHLPAVSVVADFCVVAGSASTIAMLKDEAGPGWLMQLGVRHLWVDVDGRTGGSL